VESTKSRVLLDRRIDHLAADQRIAASGPIACGSNLRIMSSVSPQSSK
jgi:hypothetical protein